MQEILESKSEPFHKFDIRNEEDIRKNLGIIRFYLIDKSMFPSFYPMKLVCETGVFYINQALIELKDVDPSVLAEICSDITSIYNTSIVTWKNRYDVHKEWLEIFNILKGIPNDERKLLLIFLSKLIEIPHYSIARVLNLLVSKNLDFEKDECMTDLLEFYRKWIIEYPNKIDTEI